VEAEFMVELFLGMILVALLGLLTMQDLRMRFPSHPNPFPYDEDLDEFDWPRRTPSARTAGTRRRRVIPTYRLTDTIVQSIRPHSFGVIKSGRPRLFAPGE
jgi:hypothetical protein